MQAMLFAAGLGTRLRPLTNDRPKALVEVDGQPLLEIALNKLAKAGFRKVVVNVHHFADRMFQFINGYENSALEVIISDEQGELLETGGGLKKAWHLFEPEPILIMNVDILSNLNLKSFWEGHQKCSAIASLAIRDRETSRKLLFDDTQTLVGWKNMLSGETRLSNDRSINHAFGFSGIQIVNPEIASFFPDKSVFSIIDVYLEAARTEVIVGVDHSNDLWIDVGKPAQLAFAQSIADQLIF